MRQIALAKQLVREEALFWNATNSIKEKFWNATNSIKEKFWNATNNKRVRLGVCVLGLKWKKGLKKKSVRQKKMHLNQKRMNSLCFLRVWRLSSNQLSETAF